MGFTEKKFDFFETEPDELCEIDGFRKTGKKYISNRILLGKKENLQTEPDDLQTEPEKKMGEYIFKPPKFLFKLNRKDLRMEKKIEDWETEIGEFCKKCDIEISKTNKLLEEEEWMFDWVFNSPRADSDSESESDWVRFTEKKSDFFEIDLEETDE